MTHQLLQEQPHALHYLADATVTEVPAQEMEWAFNLDKDCSNLAETVQVSVEWRLN